MKCKLSNNKLIKFLNNELSEVERKEMEIQINDSKSCQKILDELQATYALVNNAPRLKENPNLYLNIINRDTESLEKEPIINIQNGILFRVLRLTLMIVSFALTLIIGITIGDKYTEQSSIEVNTNINAEFYMNALELENVENYIWDNK